MHVRILHSCADPAGSLAYDGVVVSDAVPLRVAELAGHDLSHAADAAVAGESARVLDALRNAQIQH
jgi:hypothetical protein